MQACKYNKGIQFNCKYHQEYKPRYISLINSQGDVLLCMLCLEQYQQNNNLSTLNNLQSIETLLRSSFETVLPMWPPLNNQGVLLQVDQQNNDRLNQKQQQIITKYFNDLKIEINELIDRIHKETMQKLNNIFSQQDDTLLQFYNDIAQKEKVKDILMKDNISFVEANNQIKEILIEQHLNKQTNEDKILDLLNKISGSERFDISRPNEIKEEIIKMIKKINFFSQIQEQQSKKALNPQTSFHISNFADSQKNLTAQFLDNSNIQFTKKNKDDYQNTILSKFILDNPKTYKIIFAIDYNLDPNYFLFVGLTSKGEMEQSCSNNYSFCIAYADTNNGFGMDKVIRGSKNDLRYNYQQFELKINISSGILEISDFPNHDNIIGINDDRKIHLQRETNLQIAFSICFRQHKLIVKQIEEILE